MIRLVCQIVISGSWLLGAVSIESTGALPPEVLFTESIKILTEKCQRILTELL
jgi:DNA-directed RNA polymerase I and III subunit RPAC1